MATLFVRHQVADYAAWRRVYDGFEPTRKALGVTAATDYQDADDPNEITATHEFATLEAAQAFAGSSELKVAMHDAGVVGAPTIWFTQRV
jgi:hypothetical protein